MNFFEAQAKAKKHTAIFMALFTLAILGLIVLTNIVLLIAIRAVETESLSRGIESFQKNADPVVLISISLLVLIVVGSGSLYMFRKLSQGGEFVAVSLGGRKVNSNTDIHQERQLLNVVQEISIASGVAVPSVYILDDKSINAFAAGHSMDDVVIGVTQGLLDFLSREELQGVIAHEFSHIFNGDMKINMKLTGSIHGILLIGLIGEGILRLFFHSRGTSSSSSRSSSDKKDGAGNLIVVILAVAAMFYIIGLLGKLIGGLIKAQISRKREYLADATAVQYTRYPQGIAGALKKIGGLSEGSQLESPQSSTFSHLYFANGMSGFFSNMFATHPPLEQRILAIDARWDGRYPKVERIRQAVKEPKRESKSYKKEQMAAVIGSAAVGAKMASIGQPQEGHIEYAKELTQSFSEAIKDKFSDTLGAQTLILALVADSDSRLQERQRSVLPEHMLLEFRQSLKLLAEVKREHYLELVQLAMPALKSSSLAQYKAFQSYLIHFIEIDKRVTLFEWCLQHLILRPLDKVFGLHDDVKMIYSKMGELKEEVEILFSMLAQAQYKDEAQAQKVFDKVSQELALAGFNYIPKKEIGFGQFTTAIISLEMAKLPLKKDIMEGTLAVMMADDKLSVIEYEMIHAIAEILQIPLPPLQVL